MECLERNNVRLRNDRRFHNLTLSLTFGIFSNCEKNALFTGSSVWACTHVCAHSRTHACVVVCACSNSGTVCDSSTLGAVQTMDVLQASCVPPVHQGSPVTASPPSALCLSPGAPVGTAFGHKICLFRRLKLICLPPYQTTTLRIYRNRSAASNDSKVPSFSPFLLLSAWGEPFPRPPLPSPPPHLLTPSAEVLRPSAEGQAQLPLQGLLPHV